VNKKWLNENLNGFVTTVAAAHTDMDVLVNTEKADNAVVKVKLVEKNTTGPMSQPKPPIALENTAFTDPQNFNKITEQLTSVT
jgi:hypothetical protein